MNPPTRVKHLVNSFWMVETCCCSKKAKTTAPKQRQMVSCEQRGLLRDSEYHAPPSNIWIFFMLWRSPRTIFFFVSCLGKRINPTKRLDGRRGRDCSGISSFFWGKKQSKSDAIRLNSVKPGDCGLDTNHIFHRAWNIFACLFVDGAPGLVNVDHSWCQHSEDSNFYIPVRSLPRGIIPIKLRADMQTDKHTTYNVNPGAIVIINQ